MFQINAQEQGAWPLFKKMENKTNSNTTVVLDGGIPQLGNNKLFDPTEASKVMHTILPLCYLHDKAAERGIVFITPDVFFALEQKPPRVFLISHGITADTEKLIAQGVKPLILFNQETPFVATGFYSRLQKFSSWFPHAFLFAGAKPQVSKKTHFHTMYFPQSFAIPAVPFEANSSRKFLVFIIGAKSAKKLVKNIVLKLLYGFGVREINTLRRQAIAYFSQKEGFDLFGLGWDKIVFSGVDPAIIQQAYKGPLFYGATVKLDKLREYKFTLSFENTFFPGYVTEKMFDPMIAGSIPIYLGAPDITEYVPESAFIDFRKFKNFDQLYEFISTMSDGVYQKYLAEIYAFLHSPQYHKFTQEVFAEDIIKIIEHA